MPKKKEKAVVPRLRFPEFRDAGEWEVKKIGDIFRITRGNVLSMMAVSESPSPEYPYPVYSSQTKNDGLSGYYSDYLHEDSITWTTDGANAGDVKYREGRFYCTNVCGVLISEDGHANSFVAELLNTVTKKHVSYVGNPKLMNGVMAQIQIPFPKIEEQRKIADCLASLDDLIRAGEAQLVALKDHKKGLMQQLFPREGETTPRLRFPEFRDAGEWEVKRLGEVCDFLKGKGLPKKEITPAGSVLCVHYGELFTDYGEIIRRVKSFTNGDNNYVLSEVDDVLMPTSDVTPNGLAKASCIKQSSVVLGGDILVIRLNKELVFGEYLSRLIRFREQEVFRYVSGTTVFHLYPDSISKLRVLLPRLPEQQKIADCLASLDDLIRTGEAQLVALKDHQEGPDAAALSAGGGLSHGGREALRNT